MPGADQEATIELEELFALGRLLGEGGMGAVHEATQRSLGRPVALKVLKPAIASDPLYRERFLREVRLASQLKHPNIVGILDFGQTASTLYIAYQKIDGPSLADRLGAGPPLPEAEVIELFASLLEGLREIHQAGIVHRDIKPGNVLLDGARPLITDLGIARELDRPAITEADLRVGTPAYMAPEQIRSAAIGPQADLYATACMLFEVLTGSPPFVGDPAQVLQGHLSGAVPKPSAPGRTLKAGWARLFEQALAKEPGDRFPDAARLRRALLEVGSTRATALRTLALGAARPGSGGTRVSSAARTRPVEESADVRRTSRKVRSAWRRYRGRFPALAAAVLVISVTAVAFRSGRRVTRPDAQRVEDPRTNPLVPTKAERLQINKKNYLEVSGGISMRR